MDDEAGNSPEVPKRTIKDWGTPFKPGVSGNPAGRPKGVSIAGAILRNLSEADADEIAKAWIRDAIRGKLRHHSRESLIDRTDGKVPNRIGGVLDDDGNERPILIIERPAPEREG